MNTDADERWLEVLAGRGRADDADTRQAQVLRGYFERRAAAEMSAVAADEQREKRVLNALRAQGAFDAPSAAAHAPSGGVFARAIAWLLPPGGGRSARYALAAAALAAVIAVPLLSQHGNDGSDMKATRGASEAVLSVADPAAEAAELQVLLGRSGVDATIDRDAGDIVVRAAVAPEARNAVQAALMSRGVVLPPDGRLLLRLRTAP